MADVAVCRVFARNLNRYLDENKMTQLDLATRLGVAPASVNDWVKARSVPRTPTLQKLTEVFSCSLSDLMVESTFESTLCALDVNVTQQADGSVIVLDGASGATLAYSRREWSAIKARNDAKAVITALQSGEDKELTDYLEMLRTRPECRMLFSLTKDATKEDVEKAVAIIEALRGVGDK